MFIPGQKNEKIIKLNDSNYRFNTQITNLRTRRPTDSIMPRFDNNFLRADILYNIFHLNHKKVPVRKCKVCRNGKDFSSQTQFFGKLAKIFLHIYVFDMVFVVFGVAQKSALSSTRLYIDPKWPATGWSDLHLNVWTHGPTMTE